jgi:hypothetical protein
LIKWLLIIKVCWQSNDSFRTDGTYQLKWHTFYFFRLNESKKWWRSHYDRTLTQHKKSQIVPTQFGLLVADRVTALIHVDGYSLIALLWKCKRA